MSKLQVNLEGIFETAGQLIVTYGVRLLTAIVVLLIGLWLAGKLSRMFYSVMVKREVDPSLRGFLKGFISILLNVLVFISVLTLAGVPMTAFITILGAAGLAIGLALSGTLQNFAGGMLILTIKPFKVGDFIEAQNFMGTVTDIQIFNTILQTIDNVVVILPNGGLATGAITNYSVNETRRGQWVFSMAYGESFPKAKEVLKKVLEEDKRVLSEPEPMIFVSDLNDSSVDITVRGWANAADFWPLNFDIRAKVYEAFAKEGITIPFPQMDVHLQKEEVEQKAESN